MISMNAKISERTRAHDLSFKRPIPAMSMGAPIIKAKMESPIAMQRTMNATDGSPLRVEARYPVPRRMEIRRIPPMSVKLPRVI